MFRIRERIIQEATGSKGMHRYARTDFGRRPIQGQEDHGFLCVEEMSEGDRRFSDQ